MLISQFCNSITILFCRNQKNSNILQYLALYVDSREIVYFSKLLPNLVEMTGIEPVSERDLYARLPP